MATVRRTGDGRVAAPILCVLAAVLILLGIVLGYAGNVAFDSDEFADRATSALKNDAVRAEIADRITDDVVLNAQQDLVGFRPVIESVADGLISTGVFQAAFRGGVNDVHRAFFDGDSNTVTLTLGDLGVVLRGAVQALQPKLTKEIPGGFDVDVAEVSPPGWVADVVRLSEQLALAVLAAFLLAAGLALIAFRISPDRRRTALQLGIAVVIAGVAGVVGLSAAKAIVVGQFDEQGLRDAVAGAWEAFFGDLSTSLYLFAAAGAVVAAAASSLLRPVDVVARLRGGYEWATTVPEARWKRAARALALIVVGVLIIARRDAVVDLIVILAGLFVIYAGVAELMRLALPTDAAEAAADRAAGTRALIAAGIASALILVGGAVFITTGGIRQAPAAIQTVGCNGSEDLCDQPFNEVAFASTHNAMSAATYPDYLFSQQEAGLAAQLQAGVHGLFIDAHYGTPTEAGQIKTDLSDVEGPERQEYVESLGSDALDAALRIRDRIVNSPAAGPRGVYLCHRFCELGVRADRQRLQGDPRFPRRQPQRGDRDRDRGLRSAGGHRRGGSVNRPDRLRLQGRARTAVADPPGDDRLGRAGADAVRERGRRHGGALLPRRLPAGASGDAVLVQAPRAAHRPGQPAGDLRSQPRAAVGEPLPDQPLDRQLARAAALERGDRQRPAGAHGPDRAVRAPAPAARQLHLDRLLPRGRRLRGRRRAQRGPGQSCSYGFGFTLNLNFAGDPSVLPAASVARTRNLCLASLTFFL